MQRMSFDKEKNTAGESLVVDNLGDWSFESNSPQQSFKGFERRVYVVI